MVADLGGHSLPAETLDVVIESALTAVGAGIGGITTLQGRLGTAEQQVGDAQDRIVVERDILARQLSQFEDVDPFDVSVRLSTLSAQLEAAYAATARIQRLTLLDFI